MDNAADFNARYRQILIDYCRVAELELRERWDLWPFKAADNCVHEVVGGLLARQTTLATRLTAVRDVEAAHRTSRPTLDV